MGPFHRLPKLASEQQSGRWTVPQLSIEFEVKDIASIGSAADELIAKGYELLHGVKTEPWGQTIARLQTPEGVIVGISHAPSLHNDSNQAKEMILVTGATGNMALELVRQLAADRVPVRALIRGDRETGLPAIAETVRGDLNEPESLAPALKDVRGVFLLCGYRDMPRLLAQIHAAGAAHVVLLLLRSLVDGNPENAIVRMWIESEDAGISRTVLRPNGFTSNALRWLPQLRAGDVVRAPFAGVPIAAIAPHDIAAVAAVLLTSKDTHRVVIHGVVRKQCCSGSNFAC